MMEPRTQGVFEKFYRALNTEQRQAVDAIDGPVMVVAGPGTGKTHLLTMRIANILRLTDTPPESVLALTFTDSAAHAMRERLLEIIGTAAYRVHISTFHGFCNDVIRRFPGEFARIIGSTPASEAYQLRIMEAVITDETLALEYLILFGAMPRANRSIRIFGSRVVEALNAEHMKVAPAAAPIIMPMAAPKVLALHSTQTLPESPRGYSSYEGFKSFAKNGALSIDDIVKGLSQKRYATVAGQSAQSRPNVEPIYEQVEPIEAGEASGVPADVRGFTFALIGGDRAAVFAGLRQQVRGAGSPEALLTAVVCLIDDVYRSRIDGSVCDSDIARLAARLSTPTLEKLVAALTTAIDASYSTGMTGAKLALTRALAVLGA